MINWNLSREESNVIMRIAKRAAMLAHKSKIDYKYMDAVMDLTACHKNGNELNLEQLESFSDSDFSHDLFGIRKHINRKTGELKDCFVPRCSVRAVEMSH